MRKPTKEEEEEFRRQIEALDTRPEILMVGISHGRVIVVVSNGLGHYCGYVRIEEGHPWHGRHYYKIPADVHGGLTFTGERDWAYKPEDWKIEDGAPPGYYIGFDCGHYNDAPIPGSYMDLSNQYFTKLNEGQPSFLDGNHQWTVEEVRAECDSLALQAEVASVAGLAP